MALRRICVATLLGLAVAALTAASSPASRSSRAAGAYAPCTVETCSLTVNEIAPLANFSALYVAQAEGLFTKYGVKVNLLEAQGAQTLPEIVSGQADLTANATTAALLLDSEGQQTLSLGSIARDPGSFLFAASGITSIQQLSALGSKCHIAVNPPGTQSYGYAYLYTHDAAFAKLGLQQCQLDNTPTLALEVAQLASGQDQAVVGTYTTYAVAKQAVPSTTVLINANLPNYRKTYNLPQFFSGTYFGLKSNLLAKRNAVVSFLQAICAANKILVPKNINRIADDLAKFNSFAANSAQTNRTSVQFTIRTIGEGMQLNPPSVVKAHPNAVTNDPEWISKADWTTALQQYGKWGVPGLDVSADYASYKNNVDMTFLGQALLACQKAGTPGC